MKIAKRWTQPQAIRVTLLALWMVWLTGLTLINVRGVTQMAPYYVMVRDLMERQDRIMGEMETAIEGIDQRMEYQEHWQEELRRLQGRAVTHR